MKRISASQAAGKSEPRTKQQGSARTILLVSICAAIAAGAFWYWQTTKPGADNRNREPEKQLVSLSGSSKAVLGRLDSPVEIRFYSLLDPASVPESVRDFAARVDQLLAAYERAGNGKVNVTRHNSRSDADMNAAAADGIQAFNRDKGDVCYLGITVARNDKKESLPMLSPEWEPALESDLSRAIARVTAVTPPAHSAVSTVTGAVNSVEELKRVIPNLNSVSLEEGTRLLRETALQEFKKTADDMSAQVKEAQQQLTATQGGQSEAEQQAAMKKLQQVQLQQTEQLQKIAAKLSSQIAALQQIKKAAGTAPVK